MKRIDHINIVVHDLARAQQFFLDLGFTVKRKGELQGKWIDELTGLKDVRAEHVTMALGDDDVNVELLAYYVPKAVRLEKTNAPNALGLRHLAFEVTNIEAEVAHLKEKGIRFISDVQHYHPSRKKLCYLWGPEGIILELAEYDRP